MVRHTAFLTFARRVAARGRRPGEDVPEEPELAGDVDLPSDAAPAADLIAPVDTPDLPE